MSWSVFAIGRPAAVAAKIEKDLAAYRCIEPEETVKQTAGAAIVTAVKSFAPNTVVRVQASGHQGTPDYNKPTEFVNTLSIQIEPVHGFVEDVPVSSEPVVTPV